MMPRVAKSPNPTVELYWTIPQVAERLHSGRSSVNRWLAEGKLKRTKAGGKTLIAESDLQQFLQNENRAAA